MDKVKPMTREAFEHQRQAARQTAKTEGRIVAFWSVGLGLAQLLFLWWAETHMARGTRQTIAVIAVLAYLALVFLLLRRLKQRVREASPTCPQCGITFTTLSERVAAATGKCDSCGGAVFE